MIILGSTLSFMIMLLLFHFTLFNPEYHKNLFSKFHVYTTIERMVYNTQNDILEILEEEISEVDKNTLVYTLEETLTRKKIENHINQSLYELMDYMKNKRETLPDIYIHENLPENLYPEIKESIPPIINSRTLLSYFNKDEILYSFLGLRLVFFSMVMLQVFSLSLFFFTLVLLFIYSKNFKVFLNHLYGSILTGSIILLVFSLITLFFFIPKIDMVLTPSWIGTFSPPEILSSYFIHMLKQLSTYFVLFSGVFLILAIGMRIFSDKFDKGYQLPKEKTLFISVSLTFLMITLFGILYIYHKNNDHQFLNTYRTVFLNVPTTEIIPAEDSTLKSIRIVTLEKETSTAISFVPFEITGVSEDSEPFAILGTTDETGSFSSEIPKGRFRLYFPQESLPQNYVQPTPYHFYIDSAGTFLITLHLEEITLLSTEGTLEIMILDEENFPFENIALQLTPFDEASREIHEDSMDFYELSITNAKGIAVFKTLPGEYMASIIKDSLMLGYLEKSPFKVIIPKDGTARYTIKLSSETYSSP
jgi:hypothetical protein